MLTFTEYQTQARATAIYPATSAVVYPALGLCEEAGEVAGKLAKAIRGSTEVDKPAVKKELGDVLWQLANLAFDLGLSLEEIATENIEKLRSRQARGVLNGSGDDR